jgi:hypothetical protein
VPTTTQLGRGDLVGDNVSGSTNRRGFLQRTAGALFAFAGTGWLLAKPDDAWAAKYVPCKKGHVYCNLIGVDESVCYYECYDNKTLDYCYGFCEPC